ncbi:MAG: hypothetical protein CMK07_10715 [Ponticaulis sp.]|nr:hypothetical protein [Ponticaulis sp.]
MRHRRRSKKQPFGWISALIFNSLLLATAYVTGLVIIETRQALGEEFAPTREALDTTRANLGEMFTDLIPQGQEQRQAWADRIDQEVRNDDLASARGFLLAAPYMLNDRDAAAINAAARTDTSDDVNQSLLSAAKLFLPDDIRARYERAVSPPAISIKPTPTEEADAESATEEDEVSLVSTGIEDSFDEPLVEFGMAPSDDDASTHEFFVLGDARDLAFQSAGWVRGDRTDIYGLSISGLGLTAQEGLIDGFNPDHRFYEGASLMKSAMRANRLNPEFLELQRDRLEMALPREVLYDNLQIAFAENSNLLIQTDAVFGAFAESIDIERLMAVASDFERIAQLAEDQTMAASMTLLGTVSSLRDLKRAELVAVAGGDMAVTLAKYKGAETLGAATTIMDWTSRLVFLMSILGGLGFALGWLSLITFWRSFYQ